VLIVTSYALAFRRLRFFLLRSEKRRVLAVSAVWQPTLPDVDVALTVNITTSKTTKERRPPAGSAAAHPAADRIPTGS
jgi:hypothetical protein